MKKIIVILISLLLLLIPASVMAAQDEKQTDVEKPKTKYEVAQKLYEEYNITPPSNYVPPSDSYAEMNQEALDEFERLMRDAYERGKKATIENEKKIKALGDVEWIPVKIINGSRDEVTSISINYIIEPWSQTQEITYGTMKASGSIMNPNGYWQFYQGSISAIIWPYGPYEYDNVENPRIAFFDAGRTCAITFSADLLTGGTYNGPVTEYAEFYASSR